MTKSRSFWGQNGPNLGTLKALSLVQTLVVECLRASLLGNYKGSKPLDGDPFTSFMVENRLYSGETARPAIPQRYINEVRED